MLDTLKVQVITLASLQLNSIKELQVKKDKACLHFEIIESFFFGSTIIEPTLEWSFGTYKNIYNCGASNSKMTLIKLAQATSLASLLVNSTRELQVKKDGVYLHF